LPGQAAFKESKWLTDIQGPRLFPNSLIEHRRSEQMNGETSPPRARVFISCGQNKETAEAVIATQLRDKLLQIGFDPYIAVAEQTLRGLKENVFARLSNSEFFIFVDFKWERIGNDRPAIHRGSLFSHQELALASYLDLDVLAFQEASVKRGDGILGFLQTNTIEFTERHLLSDQIIDHVKKRGWDAQWRNELAIIRNPNEFTDPQVRNMDNKLGRFYHIEVCNRHREKTAKNCYVYLAKAAKLDPRTEITTKTVELKWAGYVWPNAHVLSKKLASLMRFGFYTNSRRECYSNCLPTRQISSPA
jgi:hypothetical protein